LEQLPSTGAVCEAFKSALGPMGFAGFVAGRLPSSGNLAESEILARALPNALERPYLEQCHFGDDPVLGDMMRRYKPISWADVLGKRDLAAKERQALHLFVQCGFDCGYAVPIFELNGQVGFVSLVGRKVQFSDPLRRDLELLSTRFYRRVSTLEQRHKRPDVVLSNREIEVLSWIAAGKSDWQIGQILDISSKTVNYHVENAKRKFDVATRIQAVVKAMRLGMLQE